jgi:hypothetical protein
MAVATMHPLVRARITDGSAGPWFEPNDEFGADVVRVMPRTHEKQWRAVADAELNAAFERGAPLVRVTLLIAEDGTRSDIVLTCHHAAFDAQSIMLIARELLTTYEAMSRGEGYRVPAAAPLPAAEQMLGYPLTTDFTNGPLRAFVERQVALREQNALDGFTMPSEETLASSRSHLLHRFMPRVVAEMLRSRTRAEGVSVQSALGAALLAAGRDEILAGSGTTLPLVTAVTLRRRLPTMIDKHVGLFSSGVRTAHRVDQSTNFWRLAREIQRDVEVCIREQEDVAAFLLQREAVREYMAARAGGFAWLSNLGALDFPRVAGGRVRAAHAAAAMHAYGPIVLAPPSTAGEQFSWNFIHPDPAVTPEVADAFSRRTVEHLIQACREDLPTTLASPLWCAS